MSSDKRSSWRKGKLIWRGRLYLAPDTMKKIEKQASAETRDVANVISRTVEKIFGLPKDELNEKPQTK